MKICNTQENTVENGARNQIKMDARRGVKNDQLLEVK